MTISLTASKFLFNSSSSYLDFLDEREEILKHKWIESEKKGHDIGYSAALINWIINHRNNWRESRNK